MANGITVMNPAEARAKAAEMKKIAGELEALLNDVSMKINEIDNTETGTYQGSKKPAELRAELNEFRGMFVRVYEQIDKSAKNIIEIANTKENE